MALTSVNKFLAYNMSTKPNVTRVVENLANTVTTLGTTLTI